jgi:alpha-galactosidase
VCGVLIYHQDPKTTYPIMSKAMNTTGRSMHFNMCEWGKENPWEWGDDVAQVMLIAYLEATY